MLSVNFTTKQSRCIIQHYILCLHEIATPLKNKSGGS